ncbi:hypothetical protein [Verrucosispora sp. WMMC514]|uniref:vWA domain-containing protein n=1 Tax=Verrucosispora sp. WMMC514 TaxID=3015156 RepID=UPI00248BF540|nr:hypothetical protein [Verrucosispora sp. WMMC514]WBB93379.1 hypothetical protein O7597_10575 [Verrucosispora sp. WMMC514]
MTDTLYEPVDEPTTVRKFHVIYLVLDVSDTMRRTAPGEVESPFERFQILLPDLVLSLRKRAIVRTTCWLSLISFASTATLMLPAASLREIPVMPDWPKGGQTDYVAALRLLHQRIDEDRTSITLGADGRSEPVRVADPLVFFITDGYPYVGNSEQPQATWLAARDEITSGMNGRIAAVGLQGAREDVLVAMATGDGARHNAFIADNTLPATLLAQNIVNAIVHSVALSTAAGTMIIETPPGMRRLGGGQ